MSDWHCIRTATRQEQRVVDGLRDMAYDRKLSVEIYLPCETRWNRLTRVKTVKQVPMLPGYLFIRIEADQLWRVNALEGVYQILGWATRHTRTDTAKFAEFVEGLRALEAAGKFDKTDRDKVLGKGAKVRVSGGQFTGLLGEIVEARAGDRMRVMLNVFGRLSPINMPAKHLEPQDKAPAEAA